MASMTPSRLAAALLAAAAAFAPVDAFYFPKDFACGSGPGKVCCIKFRGTGTCDPGLVCRLNKCVTCGIEGAPICSGKEPCVEGFVLEKDKCVPDVPPDDGCGSLDELCCISDSGLFCDEDLVCDGNVQALLGPGVCRECGALDELPCADGSCDKGLENVDGVCIDPTAPPPPPCGAPGEPCCTGVNIPFDSNGCDPDNNCEFGEDFTGPGVCEPCGSVGEECCTIQNDDILSLECTEEETSCGPEGICVSTPCGQLRQPCCDLGEYGNIPSCDVGFVCNPEGECEFEAIVEGQAPIEDYLLEEVEAKPDPDPESEEDEEAEEKPKPTGNDVDVDIQEGVAVAGTRPPDAPPVDTSEQETVRTEERTESSGGGTKTASVKVTESTV